MPVDPLLFRGVERLVIVVFAGLSIYWGYRLFDKVLANGGELIAKGQGYGVTLRNVGPGVYFSFFGMVVLVVALSRVLDIDLPNEGGNASSVASGVVARSQRDDAHIKYENEMPVAGDIERDASLRALVAISVLSNIARNDGFKDNPRANEIINSVTELNSYRPVMIDRIYGPGSYDFYQKQSGELARVRDRSALKNLSEVERKKFEAIEEALR